MLRVDVMLLPEGDESRATLLGRAELGNMSAALPRAQPKFEGSTLEFIFALDFFEILPRSSNFFESARSQKMLLASGNSRTD